MRFDVINNLTREERDMVFFSAGNERRSKAMARLAEKFVKRSSNAELVSHREKINEAKDAHGILDFAVTVEVRTASVVKYLRFDWIVTCDMLLNVDPNFVVEILCQGIAAKTVQSGLYMLDEACSIQVTANLCRARHVLIAGAVVISVSGE